MRRSIYLKADKVSRKKSEKENVKIEKLFFTG
jgi:hypothetical protein